MRGLLAAFAALMLFVCAGYGLAETLAPPRPEIAVSGLSALNADYPLCVTVRPPPLGPPRRQVPGPARSDIA